MTSHLLVVDQGTTSTRSIVFTPDLSPVAAAQEEFPQLYPHPGWVEHDPEDLWNTTLRTARGALAKAGLAAADIAALGIANQRETTLVWDRSTGRAIHNAIVWQDRRTAPACEALERAGHGDIVQARTGLRLDPYFSGTKIGWILDNVPGAREAANSGRLAFGTVDSFLLWRLTGGAVHAIDATNASRTLLCDIETGQWDDELLDIVGIPRAMLPEIRDSSGDFGTTAHDMFDGAIAIRGVAGDQQAALVGQGCFRPGAVKATFGTGAFVLLTTGERPMPSRSGLLTTIAWQRRGKRHYALEGSIFSAGASVQWLRDGIGIVETAADTAGMAAAADPDQPVYLVPAFTGLGAPHWNSEARALLTGLTRGTTRREIARATLETIGYQTRDLLGTMLSDYGGDTSRTIVRVDGGMTASDWTMQFLADMIAIDVQRPSCLETTAVGAGYLAGVEAGLCAEPDDSTSFGSIERTFHPSMGEDERARRYGGWQRAVRQGLCP